MIVKTCLGFITFFSSIWPGALLAKNLEFPQQHFATPEEHIVDFQFVEKQLWFTVKGKQLLVKNPFYLKDSQPFGKMLNRKRWDFPKGVQGASFYYNEGRLWVLDGRALKVSIVDMEQSRLLAQSALILDQILPAPDPRGEAPHFEVRKMRGRFKKALEKTLKEEGALLKGVYKYKSGFYAVSNMQGFRFLKLSCDPKDMSHCVIKRVCQLPSALKAKEFSAISGLGAMLYLLSDYKIYKVRLISCYQSQWIETYTLPKSLPRPTQIEIFSKSVFVVGSQVRDAKTNSSIFVYTDW